MGDSPVDGELVEVKRETLEITDLTEKFINNRKDPDLKKSFFDKGVQFALSKPNCFICNYPKIAEELLLCFTLKKNKKLESLAQSFGRQLFNCTLCIDEYYRIKTDFFKNAVYVYGIKTLNELQLSLIDADIKRIEKYCDAVRKIFRSSPSTDESELYTTCGNNIIYEIIRYPFLLKFHTVNSCIINLMNFFLSKGRLNIHPGHLFPGIFVLAFHKNDKLRNYVTSLFNISIKNETVPVSEYNELRSLFDEIFKYIKVLKEKKNDLKLYKTSLRKNEANKFFCFVENLEIVNKALTSIVLLLNKESTILLQDDINFIFEYIYEASFSLPGINPIIPLKAINKLLRDLGRKVWKFNGFSKDLVIIIFEKIISSEKYQNIMKEREIDFSREDFLLTWIDYFIRSTENILITEEIFNIWKKLLFYYRDWLDSSKTIVNKYILTYFTSLINFKQIDTFTSIILENLFSSENLSFFFEKFIMSILEMDINRIESIHKNNISSHRKEDDKKLKPVKKEINSMVIDTNKNVIGKNIEEEIHKLTWLSFFKRFDLILDNTNIFLKVINLVSRLFFIYSENHNSEESYTSFILNIYLNFIKQLIGHPFIIKFYYNKDMIHIFLKHIVSPHLNISEVSYKLLESITNKKNRFEALNNLFHTFPEQCLKHILNNISDVVNLHKDYNDDYCALFAISSTMSFINNIITNIEGDYKIPEFVKSDKFMTGIFNIIFIGLKYVNLWYNKLDHDVLIDCYKQLLDSLSVVLSSIDNKGKNSLFRIIASELDSFIIPIFQ